MATNAGEQHDRGDEEGDDQRAGEAALVGLDEPVDQAGQGRTEHDEPGPVGPGAATGLGLRDLRGDDHDRDHADRQVDQEDPAPGQRRGQQPAQQRADRDGEPGDRAPDAERRAALPTAERACQQSQRHREHDRPADTLQATGQLQHERRRRHPAQHGRDREHGEPHQVHATAAEHVGQAPGGEQQCGQRQGVGVHHPLEAGEARPQVGLDVRERDVHDRHVQQQHEGPEADRDQRPPARRVRCGVPGPTGAALGRTCLRLTGLRLTAPRGAVRGPAVRGGLDRRASAAHQGRGVHSNRGIDVSTVHR